MSSPKLNDKVEQIERTLKEILNWLKFANKPALKSIIIQELDSEEKKRIYELTDGFRSQNDIEALTKVSRRMVGYYWQKWYSLGILAMSEQRKGRMQRIATLDEIGISVVLERDTTVTEFKPRYLKNILQRIFQDKYELANFSAGILVLDLSSLGNLTYDELSDKIIDVFEHADRITQSVFMQALRSRTRENLSSSEFDKYFQAWEKQISK